MPDEQELTADTPLGKYAFKGSQLNTLATVATLVVVCVIAYVGYGHAADTREINRDLASAMREMAQANREQNCLLLFEQKDRPSKALECKNNSR
jgi:hypothetical protein